MSDPSERGERVRAFLDANVLYSAAIGGRLAKLWQLSGVHLVTSEYALKEAWDNLFEGIEAGEHDRSALEKLEDLASQTELAVLNDDREIGARLVLPDPADLPILAGAIQSGCAYLITGDRKCFGAYFGTAVDGVSVILPGEFLKIFDQ